MDGQAWAVGGRGDTGAEQGGGGAAGRQDQEGWIAPRRRWGTTHYARRACDRLRFRLRCFSHLPDTDFGGQYPLAWSSINGSRTSLSV